MSRLLERARDDQVQTWAEFVATYSGLLLHTCRTLAPDRDAAMDGYAHVLAALREDDCRRLRAYRPRPGTRFTTWLVVVARRLLVDYHRQHLGRRNADAGRSAEDATRRRLHELLAAELDPNHLSTPPEGSPDAIVRRAELSDALRRALAELDPADRLLLALRFEDERPVREIAAALRLPTVFHVYRRLNAALATLRASLARRGVEESEP